MGEAKRRGTYEQRKAQAIAAGRIKGLTEEQQAKLNKNANEAQAKINEQLDLKRA